MKNYYRVMLGKGSEHAEECFTSNSIGAGYIFGKDLTGKFPNEWKAFNKEYIPVFLAANPGKSKIAAGLACGALWTVSKGIKKGDIVLSPDGTGSYRVGEITGEYYYDASKSLPHRRNVTWLNVSIDRKAMSDALRHSTGSIGAISTISQHSAEIEKLIGGISAPKLISTDTTVEDASSFALE